MQFSITKFSNDKLYEKYISFRNCIIRTIIYIQGLDEHFCSKNKTDYSSYCFNGGNNYFLHREQDMKLSKNNGAQGKEIEPNHPLNYHKIFSFYPFSSSLYVSQIYVYANWIFFVLKKAHYSSGFDMDTLNSLMIRICKIN